MIKEAEFFLTSILLQSIDFPFEALSMFLIFDHIVMSKLKSISVQFGENWITAQLRPIFNNFFFAQYFVG